MAPRKAKTQGKRNNLKIKSKVNTQKRGLKSSKKFRPNEKPLDSLKWMNQLAADGAVGKSSAVPDWLESCSHKIKDVTPSNLTDSNQSAYEEYQPRDVEKYSVSDVSEECNCSVSRYPESAKEKVPKKKVPSTNSLVTKYIKSGMNQVASFIVESAIRFGEQHGVVVPDKNTPNLYEITPPSRRFEDKSKKIRFKIPLKNGDQCSKKIKWKCSKDTLGRVQTPMPCRRAYRPVKSISCESADSLEDILPILEKLKEGGDTVTSDLDLDKLRDSDTLESVAVKERDRDRNRERGRDRERERERERERDKSRERGRDKDRMRDIRFRTLGKRHKSLAGEDKSAEEDDDDHDRCHPSEMCLWKKYKRDSVELVRQRLRNAKQRDQESLSPSLY